MAQIDYNPSAEQTAFHFSYGLDGSEFQTKMALGGERGGKSISAAVEMFTRLPWGELFWLVGPDYEQTRNEFRYLEGFLRKSGNYKTSSTPLQGSWTLLTNTGQEIVTKSANDIKTLAGRAPDGILMVEAAQMQYEAYLKCRGRVGEKRSTNPGSGWLFMNGTLEGSSGWYPDLWRSWQSGINPDKAKSFSIPSWSNLAIFPGGRNDPEILAMEAIFPPDYFLEHLGGVPVTPSGLVYKELKYDLHVKPFYYSEDAWETDGKTGILVPADLPVFVWIDPGYTGFWLGFGAIDGSDAYVLDEIYGSGLIVEDIFDAAVNHPLWSRVTGSVMDIAAKQHHGVKSASEVWQDLTGMRPALKKYAIVDELLRVRSKLRVDPITGSPHLFISPKAKRLLKEMTDLYRYKTDEGGRVQGELPIPKDNHACTGLAYGLLHHLGMVSKLRMRGALPRKKKSANEGRRG